MAKSRTADAPDAAPARTDAYTGMLGIALLALIVGCVLLYLDYSQYDGKSPPPTPKYNIPAPGAPGAPAAGVPAAPAMAPMPPMEQKEPEEKANP